MAASIMPIVMRKFRWALTAKTCCRTKMTIPERFKDGWIGKAGTYISNILTDYKAATMDIFTDARDRPVKAVLYLTAACVASVAAWSNPDEKSYERSLLNACNDLLLLSDAIRNPKSDRHLRGLMQLRNQGRIRRMNLVVCSIMWRDDYGDSLSLYDSQCEYLRPGWRDFDKRIVDIGFMNKWFYLDKAMVEYDVNNEEFEDNKT